MIQHGLQEDARWVKKDKGCCRMGSRPQLGPTRLQFGRFWWQCGIKLSILDILGQGESWLSQALQGQGDFTRGSQRTSLDYFIVS